MRLRHIFTLCCLIFGLLCPVTAKQLSSEKIVFSSNRGGNWEIYIMNLFTQKVSLEAIRRFSKSI